VAPKAQPRKQAQKTLSLQTVLGEAVKPWTSKSKIKKQYCGTTHFRKWSRIQAKLLRRRSKIPAGMLIIEAAGRIAAFNALAPIDMQRRLSKQCDIIVASCRHVGK
jgi:hypothetical protein